MTPSFSWFPSLKLIPASVEFCSVCAGVCVCVCVCGGGGGGVGPKTTLRLEDSLLIEELPGLGKAVRHRVMA